MDGVLDATSPNSGGATPRRIVKSLKQQLACVTQLVPLDGGESSRPANLFVRFPAASVPSETSVSEVRSELCSGAYEEPVEESTSSFFDQRRIRHGGKTSNSMSRSRASRTVNGSRGRPRRSFHSVSSREVDESILSYSDEPAFYHCDSETSSYSAATEGSSYSMSYTAISESVPSCSLTALGEPGKSMNGGWANRFRKNNNNNDSNNMNGACTHSTNNNSANNVNGPAHKGSGSFGSIFGSAGIDPYNGTSLNAHAQQHVRDSSSSQFATATRNAAAGHRKSNGAAAAAAAAAVALKSPDQECQDSCTSIKSPLEFKSTFSPSADLPMAKNGSTNEAPPAGDTTALPADDNNAATPVATATAAVAGEQRQRVEHVKLLERVGRGTFGDVYRAEDLDTGNIIAVKEIVVPHDFTKDVEKQLAALESEIRVMRRLHHPHVVTYLGANREGNSLRIFMEYVGGGTVGSMLQREGALSEETTRNYTAQLLEGLEYLHASHILHRDLKGDNLFLTEQNELKLGDFGQSKELADTLITQSVQGTPSFMSPEMIACSGYSFEADVWSVGCCVIQMLTGKPPFSNLDNQMAVMFAIISSKIDDQIPQNVSEGAKDFIRMCTKTNIKDRWTATQLRQHPWLLEAGKKATSAAATAAAAAAAAAATVASAADKATTSTRKDSTKRAKGAAERGSPAPTGKPPRSILLDTAALSKTNNTEEAKMAASEAAYQGFLNGDVPDNDAGRKTSGVTSSAKAESLAPKHGDGGSGGRHSKTSCSSAVIDSSGGGAALAAGAANTPHMSPSLPPQPSPSGRRPQRVRNGANRHASKDDANSNSAAATPRADSTAIANNTNVNDSQGRMSPSHASGPKPHRPSRAPGESSPRYRSGVASSNGAVEVMAGKRPAGLSNSTSINQGNASRTVNTPMKGQGGRGALSPSHPRSGSRHAGSAIQRGPSPGNQTSRPTLNAAVAKPHAPASSRPGSHLPREDRKK
ncbi:Protein kinase [Lotmaria passim]